MTVPFFRPSLTQREIDEVVACLKSGWLTTGPTTKLFEEEFAHFIGARHAVAVNSCTAALHLALEAIGLKRGELVIVPTMTFAATAEVVRYFDAVPVFIDCDRTTQCIDPKAVRSTLERLRSGDRVPGVPHEHGPVRAMIPMHYGGQMCDVDSLRMLADEFDVAVIDDAAHTMPAYYRKSAHDQWQAVGTTARISCFSFYANKCITTGEGGMATTDDDELAARMRLMSLHGMSKDAWKRYTNTGSWYYEIVAPGFKYNLTDIASAIGRVQLERATELWEERRRLAACYSELLGDVPGLELPYEQPDRRHSWHLYSIKLDLAVWGRGRDATIDRLKDRGIMTSVHWMPLHMQPYYRETFGLVESDFPVAASLWPRLVTLPLFPGMRLDELEAVVGAIKELARA